MRAAAAARREGAASAGGAGARAAGDAAANARPAGAASRAPAADRGALWITGADGAPAVLRVRTGLTDGQYTEVSGEGVAEGIEAIAGVASGPAAEAAPNPFHGVSQGQRGGPPRGF
jgi:HlyD family secretion protein